MFNKTNESHILLPAKPGGTQGYEGVASTQLPTAHAVSNKAITAVGTSGWELIIGFIIAYISRRLGMRSAIG